MWQQTRDRLQCSARRILDDAAWDLEPARFGRKLPRVIVKILNLLFAVAFLAAPVVQLNDPDPWLWIPLYLIALASCIAFQRKRLNHRFGIAVGLGALCWSVTLLPTVIRHPPAWADVFGDVKMYAPGVEEAREMGGLWLVAGWVLVLSWSVWRADRTQGGIAGSGSATLR